MSISPYQIKVMVLWLLCLIGMILHFNYHVSSIFYGVDVKRPNADGTVPFMAQMLKNVFYHLPMIFIAAFLYLRQKWFRLAMFIISIIYTISHAFHVMGEFQKETLDWAQIPLLSLVFVLSFLLNIASWDYYRYETNVS